MASIAPGSPGRSTACRTNLMGYRILARQGSLEEPQLASNWQPLKTKKLPDFTPPHASICPGLRVAAVGVCRCCGMIRIQCGEAQQPVFLATLPPGHRRSILPCHAACVISPGIGPGGRRRYRSPMPPGCSLTSSFRVSDARGGTRSVSPCRNEHRSSAACT